MFCIYWTEGLDPKSQIVNELSEVLKISESKRKEGHRFISISSEIPGNVTKLGVDVTDSSYDWKKRRK